jgi:hypothetical protein
MSVADKIKRLRERSQEVEEPEDLTGKAICGRCYDVVDEVSPANCAEKPETLIGQPIGQYHCPNCGAMVVAGCPHPPLCKPCLERRHPGFDMRPDEVMLTEESADE